MPYPDSEYPSVLRGKDKRESQRLLAAAPAMLAALKAAEPAVWGEISEVEAWCEIAREAIARAEGRSE